MPVNVNCTSFDDGFCTHQAAPRWACFAQECLVWKHRQYGTKDPRVPPITEATCLLCTPHARPQPPTPPPKRD